MKTSIEVLELEIGKPESVLKRTTATKLDIAMLADHIHVLNGETGRDLGLHQQQIQLVDDKVMTVDAVMRSIHDSIAQCQTVILTVKDTIDVQTRDLTAALEAAEHEHQERFTCLGDQLNTMGEMIRSLEERNAQQQERQAQEDERQAEQQDRQAQQIELLQKRIQMLEERLPLVEEQLPRLDTRVASFGSKTNIIEQVQMKINARILSAMRMSLITLGVIVVTVVVLGWIFLKS